MHVVVTFRLIHQMHTVLTVDDNKDSIQGRCSNNIQDDKVIAMGSIIKLVAIICDTHLNDIIIMYLLLERFISILSGSFFLSKTL